MNLGQLVHEFRVRADDLAEPYLWQNDEVVAYINEAEREAAVRGQLIVDHTSARVCHIHLIEAQADYDLHPAVLDVREVWVDDVQLAHSGVDAIEAVGAPIGKHKGSPYAYTMPNLQTLRVYPSPSDNDMKARLSVYRLPVRDMRQQDDEPELRSMYHSRLLDWALYRAFSKRDADAEDLQRAQFFRNSFEGSFGFWESAETRRRQAEHTPPVVRSWF